MERLTKREISGITYNNSPGFMCSCYCDNCSKGTEDCDRLKAMVNRLAKFEDLEEQGLLVRLPCKVGTKVYAISSFLDCIYNYEHCKATQEWKCEEDIQCEYEKRLYYVKEIKFCLTLKSAIGKTVFLTREEAEKKLEEMKGEHDAGH